VVVAVVAVRVVQVTIDQIVDVISVRDRGVPTAGSVHVVGIVAGALVRLAVVRVRGVDRDRVLVVVILVGAVKVPVVEIPDVIAVLDRYVTAVGSVRVVVVFVDLVHRSLPFSGFR
jgi:hypothetical protein